MEKKDAPEWVRKLPLLWKIRGMVKRKEQRVLELKPKEMTLRLNTDKPSLDPGKMDPEVEELCHAINCIPGLHTTTSCSGHGKEPLSIWFECNDFKGLFFLVRCIDQRYSKHPWTLQLWCADSSNVGYFPTVFWLRSLHPWYNNGTPIGAMGEEAYRQAAYLIKNMNHHLNHKGFLSLFNLDISDFDTVGVWEGSRCWFIWESYLFSILIMFCSHLTVLWQLNKPWKEVNSGGMFPYISFWE